jgi:hypothetical protein
MNRRSIISEEEKRRILSLHNKQFINENKLINEQNVSDIQDMLVNKLGFNLGKTGRGGIGVDNDLGPLTLNAIYSALTNTLSSKTTVTPQQNPQQGGTGTNVVTPTPGAGTETQNVNTNPQPQKDEIGRMDIKSPGLITNPMTNQELKKQQPKKYKVGDYPIWNEGIANNDSKRKMAFMQYILGSKSKFDQLAQCLIKQNLTQAGIEVTNDDATEEITSTESGSIFKLITPQYYTGPMTIGDNGDGTYYTVENIWDIANPKGENFKKIFKKIKLGGLDYYLTANQYESFNDTWLENGSPAIHIRICGATACSKLSADFDGDCEVLIAELQKLNGPVKKPGGSITLNIK